MTVGDQRQTWTGQLITERRDGFTYHVGIDVLAELAPDIGGTWEPITAPGSTRHPNPALQQNRFSISMPGTYRGYGISASEMPLMLRRCTDH